MKKTAAAGRVNRGLTCTNCRVRKTRCDGAQPGCKTCEVYRDECRYEKPPPMTQIVSMAKRLQEAEQVIADLRRTLDEERGGGGGSGRAAAGTPGQQQQPLPAMKTDLSGSGTATAPTPQLSASSSSHPYDTPSSSVSRDVKVQMTPTDVGSSPSCRSDTLSQEQMLSDLSLDENGKLCYHGPTSAVHAPAAIESQTKATPEDEDPASRLGVRSFLKSGAAESRSWEGFALETAAMQTGIPGPIISRLIHIHFTWVAPMFMWVYRPAFIRDMTTGGPYYSPLLLTVLCAHAARFDQANAGVGDMLTTRARLLLSNELDRPSSVPAVQALLQISAREMAFGRVSQAWLYSGMAFRMGSDLGLHHSLGKFVSLGDLTAEDLEIRRRLFWSCFFWDKAVSLYLGRIPAMTEVPDGVAPELMDDTAEDDHWSPHCGPEVNLGSVSLVEYPPTKAHSVSCFENSCKLAVIINDVILRLYSRRDSSDDNTQLTAIRHRLDDWRRNTPPHLLCEPGNLPAISPPPHILSQNLLYFSTIILLHRPFYHLEAHRAACRLASDSIEKLLLLLEGTFGFAKITYLMAYCIYTGASAMTLDANSGDAAAAARMQTYLRALRVGVVSCPVMRRSLDIITKSLSAGEAAAAAAAQVQAAAQPVGPPGQQDMSSSSSAAAAAAAAAGPAAWNSLPAFPHRKTGIEFTNLPGGMEVDGFSLLDCFPESHLGNVNGNGQWYYPA